MNFCMSNFHKIYPYYCIKCKTLKAQFNYKNTYPEQFCKNCKDTNMVDSKKFICEDNKCLKIARYIQEGDKKPKYCRDHKKENYTSINKDDNDNNKRYIKAFSCKENNCMRKSMYNFEDKKIPEYCWKHKKNDMISFEFNICLDCTNISKYDYQYKSLVGADKCFSHKEEGMINIYTEHCCYEDCEELGIYGYEKPNLFCSTHMKNDMIVLNDYMCKTLFCEKIIKKNQNKGLCSYCFVNLHQEEAKNTKMRNSKELNIIQYIMKIIPEKNFMFNKKINSARPDIILRLENHIIIIEIDENQHKGYIEECERKRINELYCDLEYKNIILIRFNPDNYIDSFKNKKESCFKLNENGKYILDPKQKKQYSKRMKKLTDTILYYIEHITKEPLTTIHLFFDGYHDEEEAKKYMNMNMIDLFSDCV